MIPMYTIKKCFHAEEPVLNSLSPLLVISLNEVFSHSQRVCNKIRQ